MERNEDTRPVREGTQREESEASLNSRSSGVGTAGGSLFNFPGLQTTHTDINAAHRTVQKDSFHSLKVRVESATRDAGDLLTDTAGLFCKTTTADRIAR